jgi:HAD superfamily hydrolase (TIGR01509 family)
MIKGILFDIDGTLVLSNDAHAAAWQDAFAEHGYNVSFEAVRRLIGMGGDKLVNTLFPELSYDVGLGKTIKERRVGIFQEKYVAALQPTPGSRELVSEVLQRGLRTMVASSASKAELDALLQAANVADLLTEATTSDDAENSKPDPDIIQVALQKINLPADEVVMLGDTPYDVEAAGKAGVKCVGVLCGGWSKDDLQGAVAVYQDPADILAHSSDFEAFLPHT